MKLNDHQIRNAKPAKKPYKLNDGKGSCIAGGQRGEGTRDGRDGRCIPAPMMLRMGGCFFWLNMLCVSCGTGWGKRKTVRP